MDKFGKGFRTPPLTKQLKNILHQYPNDGQILKELIQNAEDAGATEVKFLLDTTSYGTEPDKLIHPELAQFQGPALYTYNNAQFNDDDWESIAMLMFSKKENDPLKVGRFGMGFKAVFHMTDLPSLMSGGGIGFMDPHERYFTDEDNHRTSCKLLKFSEDSDSMKRFEHQFHPFHQHRDLFGVTSDVFHGGCYAEKTLFRFPLRTASAESDISDNVYTPDKVRQLFNDLKKDGGNLLLFLLHLQHIEIYEYTSEKQCSKLEKLMDISISKPSFEIVSEQREIFKRGMLQNNANSLSISFPITIELTKGEGDCCFSKQTFIVTLFHSNDKLLNEEVKKAKESLKVIPLGGVAMKIDFAQSQLKWNEPAKGQVYCFLPLPLEARSPTGLATHVHGYFVLDQNRRHLKWPDAARDISDITDPHHIWNVFLVKELLPQALIQMALFISQNDNLKDYIQSVLGCTDIKTISKLLSQTIVSAMPNIDLINPSWMTLAETFYKDIYNHQVFFTEAGNGTWVRICDENTIVALADDKTQVVDLIRKILITAGRHVVNIPKYVINGIEMQNNCKLRRIQPVDVCICLRTCSIELTDCEKLSLMEYLLKGLKMNEWKHLVGLTLLPLDDGNWINFEAPSDGMVEPRYLETSQDLQELLPGLNSHFIRRCLKQNDDVKEIAIAGVTQLKMLDKSSVLKLLSRIPGLTRQQCKTITIVNDNKECLTQNWFEIIWQYINKYCISDIQQLVYSNLYLIPLSDANQLALLSENLPLMAWSEEYSEDLKQAIICLGVFVIDTLPSYILCLQKNLNKYILTPTLDGTLEALQRISAKDGAETLTTKFHELPDSLKDAFRNHVVETLGRTCDKPIDNAKKDLLRSIPFCRTLENSGSKPQHFVSLKDVPCVVTDSFSVTFHVPQLLIQFQERCSQAFQNHLNIRVVNVAEVLCEFVFPKINEGGSMCNHNEAMKYSLNNLDNLECSHAGFKEHVSKVHFISNNKSMQLRRPNQLFDDSDPYIRDLFVLCSEFPCGEFSQSKYRHKLQKVGLKGSRNITALDFCNAALRIHETAEAEDTEKRGEALVFLLNESLKLKIFSETDKDYLKCHLLNLKWIPPCRNKPDNYPEHLLFAAEQSKLLSPCDVYLNKYSQIIGSLKATVDLNHFRHLEELFQLAKEPTIQEVIHHLDNIVRLHRSESEEVKSTTDERNLLEKTIMQLCDRKVTKVCDQIYEFLNEKAKTKDNQIYLSSLHEKNYVLVNGYFMNALHCATESQLNCPPFLCGLPPDLERSFHDLWKALGVKKQFDIDSYIQTVQEFYRKAGQQPLSERQTEIILKIISECTSGENQVQVSSISNIYLPDHKGVLRLATELCYNDTPWLPDGPGEILCHPLVTPLDALKLGVKSWRQKTINSHQKPLPGRRFGQHEKLVIRLKRILESYLLDEGILKELLQNADDAGATKIHFIKDLRNLPTEKTFDEKWKPVQGCSLCVYNDTIFTENDLQGIQDLGEGSKSRDQTKIGQYGVGFNCVYNLTDVPTFLTTVTNVGRVLCVMDPTLKHVAEATDDSPGFMYNELEALKQKFPDVFQGYLEAHYGTKGTVFRFPLRQQSSAISDNTITAKELSKLFNEMEREMKSCLLFLKNIREIALKEVHPDGTLKEIYRVQSTLVTEDLETMNKFQKESKNVCSKLQEGSSLSSIMANSYSYVLKICDTRDDQQDWLIVQQIGFTDPSHVSDELNDAYAKGQLNHLPLAGVAYKISNIKTCGDHTGRRLFCFLPLPKVISLPVHVNGHFSLDSENRRGLWEDDKDGIRTKWNHCLMTEVVAHAYCTLISSVKDIACKQIDTSGPNSETALVDDYELHKYRLVFPQISQADGQYLRKLCVAVYQTLWKLNLNVLPVHSSIPSIRVVWLGPQGNDRSKPCFDHLAEEISIRRTASFRGVSAQEEKHDILRRVLIKCGYPLVHGSCKLYGNFRMAGLTVLFSNPDSVFQFFKCYKEPNSSCNLQLLPCNLKETPFQIAQDFRSLLEFCCAAKNFNLEVIEAPFLLTQDEMLQAFDRFSRPFYSNYFDVVPHVPFKFAHKEIGDILNNFGLTKIFRVDDFVCLLPGLLSKEVFYGCNKTVTIEMFHNFLQYHVSSENLLKRIWGFISETANSASYQLLKEWCLLPVKSGEENLLLPISMAGNVTTETELKQTLNDYLVQAIVSIGLPVLNEKFVSPIMIQKLLNNKMHLSTAIIQHFMQNQALENLICEQRDSLFKYLATYFRNWQFIDGALDAVRGLKVFDHFDGTTGDLRKPKRFIVPLEIPIDDSSKWSTQTDAVFLKSSNELFSFLQLLGCEGISKDTLYCDYIFREFDKLSSTSRFNHLCFIRDRMFPAYDRSKSTLNWNQNSLQEALKRLNFISHPGSSGLKPASLYFDRNVPIFQMMQDASDFPPKPYHTDEWIGFLKFCGLVSEVTEEHLLKYAQVVAKLSDSDEPPFKKAKILVENIMERHSLSEEFAQNVNTLPIVPAASLSEILSKLHLPKMCTGNSKTFIGYKDSYEVEHTDLVWSTSDLLPTWAAPNRKRKLLDRLEVCATPAGKTVAQHLANICHSFLDAKSPTEAEKKEFCRVVWKIYKFLADEKVNTSELTLLENVACILLCLEDQIVLAKPDHVVVDMLPENEIRPYLYKLPHDLYEYMPLLMKLNITHELQPKTYVKILQSIYETVGHAELVPNDRRAVLMAISGLFRQLERKDAETLQELTIYLPGDDGKLYSSSMLTIRDDLQLAERVRNYKKLQFFIDLHGQNEYGLDQESYTIFEKFPQGLRPQMLSKIVLQKLDALSESAEQVCVQSNIHDHITSPEFTEALLSLVNSETGNTDNSAIRNNIKNFSKIQIYEIPRVNTYLEHEQIRVPGSEMQRNIFVSKAIPDAIKVYVDQSLQGDSTESSVLYIKLADVLNELLENALKPVLVYLPLLLQCSTNEIPSVMQKIGVKFSYAAPRKSFLPKLGSFVPIDMHHMLKQGFFRFKVGDFAALESGDLEDSVYIMVQIMEISENNESHSLINAQYAVDTGENGKKAVSGLDLYHFDSPFHLDECGATMLVPNLNQRDSTSTNDQRQIPQFKDIIRDIKKKLIEARALPDDQKRRVIKRLYLQWHPDKNPPEMEKLCTRVVQELQKLVKRLETLSAEDDNEEEANTSTSDFHDGRRFSRRQGRSSTSRTHFNFNFESFDEFAKQHRKQSEANNRNTHGTFSFSESFSTKRANPQPQEAKRWIRQAELDLQCAEYDKTNQFFEWSCYKYHQAAEKSLKAIQFKRDSNQHFTHSLLSLCSGIEDNSVVECIREMERLIPNPAAMRYPNCHNYPNIPHDVYGKEITDRVGQLAKTIVSYAKRIVG